MTNYCHVLCKNKNMCKNKAVSEIYYMNKNNIICKFHSTYLKKNKSLTLFYKSKILDLPNEILYKIINHLKEETLETLINLKITCKKFFKIVLGYIYKLTKNYVTNKTINLNIRICGYDNIFDYVKTIKEINNLITKNINMKINIKKDNTLKLIEYVDDKCNYGYILYAKDINDVMKTFGLNMFKKRSIKEITFTTFNEIKTQNIIFSITYMIDNKNIILNYPDPKKELKISNINNKGWFIRSYDLILKKYIENLKKIKTINILEINKFEPDLFSGTKINILKCNLCMVYSENALYIRNNINIDNVLVLNTINNKKLINYKYGNKFRLVSNSYFETIKRYC